VFKTFITDWEPDLVNKLILMLNRKQHWSVQ